MTEQEGTPQQKPSLSRRLQNWARELKRDVIALYFAVRHTRTPWYAKVAAAIVVGYALSPIDLIPDFVPVLGYLDDVILVPLGIALVIKLMPDDLLENCRQEALQNPPSIRPKNQVAALIIVLLWILSAYGVYLAAAKLLS